jgi:hypothetical protein
LLDAHGETLDLRLLTGQSDCAIFFPGLDVEDALARRTDGIGGDVTHGTKFEGFVRWHISKSLGESVYQTHLPCEGWT